MLRDLFRTKKRTIIVVILGFAVLIVSILAYAGYVQRNRFLEQAVMAENYLKAGSYEQAIKAYEKALSMKNNDGQSLTIGLADAYSGIHNYEKALEVLRSQYSKSSGFLIKEKIEEVISEKNDYEYLQSISHAEVYFTNGEYVKAIEDFQKAKQIKRKEIEPYQKIAEAYIELGDYDLAKEEVIQGKEITQDDRLNETMEIVESYLKLEQYREIVDQAAEYIYQENYEDGVASYQDAIYLMPNESEAYTGLAQTYITLMEYNMASNLINEALEKIETDELKNLQKQVTELIEIENEKNSIISRLYGAMKGRRISAAVALMQQELFQKDIAKSTPVYYSGGNKDSSNGTVLIIYDSKTIYYGRRINDKRNGKGIYFMLTEGNVEEGYYYYDGYWDNDLPNGAGKTIELTVLEDENGIRYENKTVTEGSYYNALEEGRMTKYFYTKGEVKGKLTYSSHNGIPVPITVNNSQPSPTPSTSSYAIGIIIQDNNSEEYYRVGSDTVWGVKPFLGSK